MNKNSSSSHNNTANEFSIQFSACRFLRISGIFLSILILWNGVGDYIFAYSPNLSGFEYLSPHVWDIIRTANHRPHWAVMLAQSAGWLYPFYALTYFHWWLGMRRAGIWLSLVPVTLLVYAVLMIGGIQHAGFAFLSVLEQAKAIVGSTDTAFFSLANRYIVEHFIMGDLSAALALNIGTIWFAIAILSGRTIYPRWFVIFSPLGALTVTVFLGLIVPAPLAGFAMALFGTWFLLIPHIAGTIWLWHKECKR